jgi:hypothetical protein
VRSQVQDACLALSLIEEASAGMWRKTISCMPAGLMVIDSQRDCSFSASWAIASRECRLPSPSNKRHRPSYSVTSSTRPGIHRFRGTKRYGIWIGTAASVRLDVGRADHLAPLIGLFGDELAELGGRARKQYAAHFSEPRLDLGISKARVDCVVEFLDDFGRRVRR